MQDLILGTYAFPRVSLVSFSTSNSREAPGVDSLPYVAVYTWVLIFSLELSFNEYSWINWQWY